MHFYYLKVMHSPRYSYRNKGLNVKWERQGIVYESRSWVLILFLPLTHCIISCSIIDLEVVVFPSPGCTLESPGRYLKVTKPHPAGILTELVSPCMERFPSDSSTQPEWKTLSNSVVICEPQDENQANN